VTSPISREAWIALGVTALAIVAMAFDHLIGDDPGLEDPPAFLISSGLSVALALIVFLLVIPRVKAGPKPADRAAKYGIVFSALAIVPGLGLSWLGLPFVLAGGGIAMGIAGRPGARKRLATAAIVVGLLALVLNVVAVADSG
jgi:hypothetical protein